MSTTAPEATPRVASTALPGEFIGSHTTRSGISVITSGRASALIVSALGVLSDSVAERLHFVEQSRFLADGPALIAARERLDTRTAAGWLEKVTSLINELLRNLSESFIRFILGELELGGNRVNTRVVSRFEPIVKKSIQTALLGMMTKSIQQEIAPVAPASPAPPIAPAAVQAAQRAEPPPPPRGALEKQTAPAPSPELVQAKAAGKPAGPPPGEPSAKDSSGIVTTEEEKEIFRAVSRICGEAAAKVPLKYKDGTNFFAINLGSSRSWFLRLFAGNRRKSFVVRLPVAETQPLAAGLQVEPIPENPDKSRVYFITLADVEKLRAVILRAYEEAVRRQQAGGSDAEDAAD